MSIFKNIRRAVQHGNIHICIYIHIVTTHNQGKTRHIRKENSSWFKSQGEKEGFRWHLKVANVDTALIWRGRLP